MNSEDIDFDLKEYIYLHSTKLILGRIKNKI